MESLGKLLVEHADELVIRWLALVRGERLGRHGLTDPLLRDSLADQLRAIGDAIQAGTSSPEGLSFAAAEHGDEPFAPHRLWGPEMPLDPEERVRQEVPIEEVVDEYAFAVDVVRSFLRESGAKVPPDEFSFFHSAVFGLVAESVRRYTAFKEQAVAREKALFVASMAHQMRNPLTTMALKLETMAGKHALAESADFRVLSRNLRRLRFLVDGVMRLERARISDIPVRPVSLDVARFIQELVADLREEADRKCLRLDLEAEPELRADLDPDLLTDALGNFLGNAIRYTEQGFVRVSVEKTGGGLVFTVTDSGPGLPAKQREEPIGPALSSGGGAGLGLVIAHRAVEALGGVVSVESTPGKGTTIAFSVPPPRPERGVEPASPPAARG